MIELKNVSKNFGGNFAVKNVSFQAQEGVITGLIGGNGAGKSTIMRMIATLLKPTEGNILVDGVDTIKYSHKVREKIGVLLGGDISLYERLTAKENILYFANLQGVKEEEAEVRIKELSRLLDMDEYINRKVMGFSRGMKQKVAFIRSIIHAPNVLLLDEPSTGLDINSIQDVQNFILYCKEQRKTVLISTHNAHEMNKLCDNLVFIEKGEVVGCGKKESLLSESGCLDVADLFFYYRERI